MWLFVVTVNLYPVLQANGGRAEGIAPSSAFFLIISNSIMLYTLETRIPDPTLSMHPIHFVIHSCIQPTLNDFSESVILSTTGMWQRIRSALLLPSSSRESTREVGYLLEWACRSITKQLVTEMIADAAAEGRLCNCS